MTNHDSKYPKTNEIDFWDELSDNVKSDVEIAIIQLDNAEGITHEIVMKKYEKWLRS